MDAVRPVHHQYAILLGLILVSLTFQLAAPEGNWARLVAVVLQAITLVAAVVTSRAHHWVVRLTVIACALLITGSVAALLGSTELGEDSARLITLLLVALAPPAIVNGLVKQYRVEEGITRQTMFGVLCIYLLIGLFFGSAYGAIESLTDEAFFTTGPGNTSDFLYFSFSTITTVGYGDFVAGTELGRSLAITEALIGQIYLVTVVALIVSNVRSASPRRT